MTTTKPALPKPATPFRPRTFRVIGPVREVTTTRPKGPIYGPVRNTRGRPVREIVDWKQPGKARVCWDLVVVFDGHRWYDRYYAAGHAQAGKERLEAGFREGWDFDPEAKRFVEPLQRTAARPTVFSESVAWWRAHWSTIEPKSRQETLRYVCRPIRDLVREGDTAPAGVDAYLGWHLLPPKPADTPVPSEHQDAASWLTAASMPVDEVDAAAWQAYVDRWRINTRTGRTLAQSSLNRHLADVKQLWAWVCAVHQLPNPWPLVKTGARSSAGGRRGSTVRPVDRSIVLAPVHVRELAQLCSEGSFGPVAELYVLLLGIAGGRPGESAGVDDSDLDAPGNGMGEVRFRRTDRRGINPQFLDLDDDPAWGPLKGREIEEDRRSPLPACDAGRIHMILEQTGARGPLFAGWDWDKFSREVWVPAKTAMAARRVVRPGVSKSVRKEAEALRSALDRLRPHDLRHAACSMWLNTPGMEVRVACDWSGHKRLSVFLDIYQGLLPGSQESAKEKLDAAWGS